MRDHLPNLLAVNFYARGDLFRVVDTLNGCQLPESTARAGPRANVTAARYERMRTGPAPCR